MSDRTVVLNAALLRERRLAAGLSQRRLADALGVRSPLIIRLEQGESHASLPLHRAQSLATILGTTLQRLLAHPDEDGGSELPPAPAADADARQLIAVLAELDQMVGRDELAEALGWSLKRLVAASRQVRRQLQGTGLRLLSTWGLSLRGDPELARRQTLIQLEHSGAARRGMNLSTAGVLREVAAGTVDNDWQRRAGNAERVSTAALLRMGLVSDRDGRLELTPEVEFSLALDD